MADSSFGLTDDLLCGLQSVEQPSEAAMPSKEQTETGLKAENAQCAVDKVKAGDSRELPKTSNEGTAIGKLVNQQLPKNVSTDKPYHSPTATQAGKTFIGAPHGVYLAGSTQDLSKAQKLADQVSFPGTGATAVPASEVINSLEQVQHVV